MKRYFMVTFQYSDDVYCSNIAFAETSFDVMDYYISKYSWVDIREATAYEVDSAKRRGMPIVEI